MDIKFGLDQALIDAVTNIVNESCGGKKKMEKEELHPNQVKLDKNKNGKLDSDDFKKLRGESKCDDKEDDDMEENFASDAQRKAVWASKNEKGVKEELTVEEVEEFMQTEAYEQLDELDKETLKSYVGKAAQSARIQGIMQMDFKHKGDKARNPGMKNAWDKMSKDAQKKGWKRQDGIKTAVDKLTKEQVEEIETLAAKHGLGE